MVLICGGLQAVAADNDAGLVHGAQIGIPCASISRCFGRVDAFGEFGGGLKVHEHVLHDDLLLKKAGRHAGPALLMPGNRPNRHPLQILNEKKPAEAGLMCRLLSPIWLLKPVKLKPPEPLVSVSQKHRQPAWARGPAWRVPLALPQGRPAR